MLQGTVLSTAARRSPTTPQTGRAASALVIVSMKVTLTDEWQGAVPESGLPVSRAIRNLAAISQLFRGRFSRLRRLSRDFARTLVSNILEASDPAPSLALRFQISSRFDH